MTETPMNYRELEKLVLDAGGKMSGGINWTWALFDDDEKGRAIFDLVKDKVEHRGYYANTGFRFR